MKIVFYVLAAGAALFGLLGIIRTVENLVIYRGLEITQLVIGVVGMLLAWIWVKRARGAM